MFTLQVVPASLSLEATSLSGPGLMDAVAGIPVYLTTAPRDAFGNVWGKGPLKLQASAVLRPASIILPNEVAVLPVTTANNADGSFLLSILSDEVSILVGDHFTI